MFCTSFYYVVNIPIASSPSTPCTHISIKRIGDSTDDSWYEQRLFGKYSFVFIDARGNAMYHANIKDIDMVITKDMENNWVVSITFLNIFTSMM